MSEPLHPHDRGGTARFEDFLALLSGLEKPTVLEVGTKRWGDRPTHRGERFQAACPEVKHIKADVSGGADVDVVLDVHACERALPESSVNAWCLDVVLEHTHRPWVVSQSLYKVTAPGGIGWACTHQTYPLHFYPQDLWRFSRFALALLFYDAGFEVLGTLYSCPCKIVPEPKPWHWNDAAQSFCNVEILVRKPHA